MPPKADSIEKDSDSDKQEETTNAPVFDELGGKTTS